MHREMRLQVSLLLHCSGGNRPSTTMSEQDCTAANAPFLAASGQDHRTLHTTVPHVQATQCTTPSVIYM